MTDQILIDVNDPRLSKPYDELVDIVADTAAAWAKSHEELSNSERVAIILGVLQGGANALILAYNAEIL